MKYIEVQVTTATEASDAIYNILSEVGAAGVLIEDLNDFLMMNKGEISWDYIEQELIDNMGTDAKVKGYFTDEEFSEEKLKEIQRRVDELSEFGLDKGPGTIVTRAVYEEDWANAWKKFYKPVKAGEKIVIKPTWEEYHAEADDLVIEMDPGMAFGTGTHETTVMCIKLLEKYVTPKSVVFDVGCGTGILGISAVKLGAKYVECVDIDKIACKVSKENAEHNNVMDKLKVKCGNLLDVVKEKADIIVANIVADIIIGFTEDAWKTLNTEGIFISSGIIKDRKDEVLDKISGNGFEVIEVLEMGEWCAIAAGRKDNA
ncbi:MAG: 50S ribosomal protein L11 methyltransferase [Lutisporaceae bacterium]